MESEESELPQIECPPCALRGSTLPVTSVPLQSQANNKSPGRPGKPINKPASVRGNRASQLGQPPQFSVELASYAVVSTNSTEDDNEGKKESQDGADNSAARSALAETQPESRSSIIASLKSPDSADRQLNDLILQSVAVAPTPDVLRIEGTQSNDDTTSRTSKVSQALNLPRLVKELEETAKQRTILKDRITNIARVMSPSQSGLTVSSDAAQPLTVGANEQQTSTVGNINQLPAASCTSQLKVTGPSEETPYPSESTSSSSSTDSSCTPPKKSPPKQKRLRRLRTQSRSSQRSTILGNQISPGARSSQPVGHPSEKPDNQDSSSSEQPSTYSFRPKRANRVSDRYPGSTDAVSQQRKSILSKLTSSTGTQTSAPVGLSSDQVAGTDQPTEKVTDRNSCSAGKHSVHIGVSSTPVSDTGGSKDKVTQQIDNRIESLVTRLSEAARECADLKLDREVARRELEAAKFDLRMTSVEVQERNADLTQARRDIEFRDERICQMAATQARFEMEASNLRNQLTEVHRQLDLVEKRYQLELSKSQRSTSQLISLEKQLNARMAELTAVTNALIEKRSSEDELVLKIQQFQRALGASEESVQRLTERLAEEQRKNQQQPPKTVLTLRKNRESQTDLPMQLPPQEDKPQRFSSSSSSRDSSSPTGTGAAALNTLQDSTITQTPILDVTPSLVTTLPALPAPTMEQRMSDLDARITRLVTDTKGRGWRNDAESFVTSTPRSSSTNPSTAQNLSDSRDATAGSLQRTSQLVASNLQLSHDVQSLRALSSDLLQSRQELKNQLMHLSQEQRPPQIMHRRQHHQRHGIINLPHNELSGYLYATETLRAMIHRQVVELQSGGARHRLPPLSQEIREQQEAVNRCWFNVERSFLAESHPVDPCVHREFYLKRWPSARIGKSSHAANILSSVSQQPQIQCTCVHSTDCPVAAIVAASKEQLKFDSLPRKQ